MFETLQLAFLLETVILTKEIFRDDFLSGGINRQIFSDVVLFLRES